LECLEFGVPGVSYISNFNSELQTPNSTLQTPHSKLHTPNSELHTPNFPHRQGWQRQPAGAKGCAGRGGQGDQRKPLQNPLPARLFAPRLIADSPAACQKNNRKMIFIRKENVLFLPPCFNVPGI